MFKKTKENLVKKINSFKKLVLIFNIVVQVYSIVMLAYNIIKGNGVKIANIILIIVSTIYLLFFIINSFKTGKEAKVAKAKNKKFKKWSKLLVKAYTLGLSIYGIYTSTVDFDLLSFVITLVMAGLWVFQISLELIMMILIYQKNKIIDRVKSKTQGLFKRTKKENCEEVVVLDTDE